MNNPGKKENQEQEQTENNKNEMTPVTLNLDELEKVTGGANFWFWDTERKKPR